MEVSAAFRNRGDKQVFQHYKLDQLSPDELYDIQAALKYQLAAESMVSTPSHERQERLATMLSKVTKLIEMPR
jgi:hypothetical protein